MTTAQKVLFGGLIDDAAMFPPSQRPLPKAVQTHRETRASEAAWILGRLLVPAGLVTELAAAADEMPLGPVGIVIATDPTDWHVSVSAALSTAGLARDALVIDDVEVKAPAELDSRDMARLLAAVESAALGRRVSLFLEIDPNRHDRRDAALDLVARWRATSGGASATVDLGIKLRCGGPMADAFPSAEVVAGFLTASRALGIPLKATQGLHHPFRTVDPITGVLQHGFVNLLAAVALADADAGAVVAEADPAAFELTDTGLRWRDTFAGVEELRRARTIFSGLGSCSVDEPWTDLVAHDLHRAPTGAR
jgi:hypothetical protein